MDMKKLVVLGAGESGVGAAVLAKREGFDVFVSDSSTIKDNYKSVLVTAGIPFEEGRHTPELLLDADEVVKSPGIPNEAPLVAEFHRNDRQWFVIELSSFQLDNMYNFKADIAVLLNITPDHLDRYGYVMQNYVDAKFRILQNQTKADAFVFWNDDPVMAENIEKKRNSIKAEFYPFSMSKREGLAAYLDGGSIVFTKPSAFNMEQEKLALTGTHNLYDSMAAGIAANIAGVKKDYIRQALSDFAGVPHRLEKVARVNGVDYVNDSKATNVNSCWYALQSMKTPVVLILGGKDKGNDYKEIEELVRQKVKGLVFLGVDNAKLHAFFDGKVADIRDARSMADAVRLCAGMAEAGDTVLLSPCCASFDLFKSYEDRGDQFRAEVLSMANH